MTRLPILLALLLTLGACASTSTIESEPVDRLDDLVEALRGGGYGVQPLSPDLVDQLPLPIAAYDFTQPDGRVFRLLAYAPADLPLLRSDVNRDRPRTGITPGRELNVRYRPARGAENVPRLFARGDILIYFPYARDLDLYYDLVALVGEPTY